MRMLLGSLLVVMGFVAGGVVIGLSGSLIADNPSRQPLQSVPSQQLIAFSLDLGNSGQQVTLIDTGRRVLGVYHIDRTSGEISLKCVRNTHWDLLMDEFNGVSRVASESCCFNRSNVLSVYDPMLTMIPPPPE